MRVRGARVRDRGRAHLQVRSAEAVVPALLLGAGAVGVLLHEVSEALVAHEARAGRWCLGAVRTHALPVRELAVLQELVLAEHPVGDDALEGLAQHRENDGLGRGRGWD